ncbi:MAG TPA: hypothetical protein VH879_07020 [Gemmatimonadales bacterium]|jgi:hypothetical protein
MSHPIRSSLLALLALSALACSESIGGNDGTPPADLHFLRLMATAPSLCQDSVGAWFIKDPNGQDKEIALTFPEDGDPANCALLQTEDFLRLKIGKTSLLRRPDGLLIPNGDSVFVSAKWVGNDSILFQLQPTGLTFDPSQPAELKIEYGEAGEDLNDDGRSDNADSTVQHQLDIWRQENPGDPFFRIGTAHSEEDHEIEAKLNGFSRIAIAY